MWLGVVLRTGVSTACLEGSYSSARPANLEEGEPGAALASSARRAGQPGNAASRGGTQVLRGRLGPWLLFLKLDGLPRDAN